MECHGNRFYKMGVRTDAAKVCPEKWVMQKLTDLKAYMPCSK